MNLLILNHIKKKIYDFVTHFVGIAHTPSNYYHEIIGS